MTARYTLSKNGVAFLQLVNPPVNAMGLVVRKAMFEGMERAEIDGASALVLHGANGLFTAGADITEFLKGSHVQNPHLHDLMDKIESMKSPMITLMQGTTLGGGMELALTTHWRVATPECRMGLPEVHLGLLPGAGGTQRLPRVIGNASAAFEIMATGRHVAAKEALSLGIIDEMLATGDENELEQFALSDRVQNTPLENRLVGNMEVKDKTLPPVDTLTKSFGGYVAPMFIHSAVDTACNIPFKKGMEIESKLFQSLMSGPQSKAMLYMFFAERKKPSFGEDKDYPMPQPIKSVGILGGGTMGSGIAMAFANAGIACSIVEQDSETAEGVHKRIIDTYMRSSKYRKGKLTDEKLDKLMALITCTADVNAFANVDLAIEAIFENMAAKIDALKMFDKICKKGAVLSTNTSALDVDTIAEATSRPEDVVGMHFFSPANIMKLLEVVQTKHSSKQTLANVIALAPKIGKIPIVAGNCYGFIGNRMLHPYLTEAINLVEEGATPRQVDKALKDSKMLGLAMGPFEMMDMAGNDIGWRQRQDLGLTDPKNRPIGQRYNLLGDKICEAGRFGQKAGAGWYKYDASAPRKAIDCPDFEKLLEEHRADVKVDVRASSEFTDEEIVERCMFPLINEGLKILEEGIAHSPEAIDICYVYGYGFPRYRGGPMLWAEREVKFVNLFAKLQSLQEDELHKHSPWLEPCNLLKNLAESGSGVKEELYHRRHL